MDIQKITENYIYSENIKFSHQESVDLTQVPIGNLSSIFQESVKDLEKNPATDYAVYYGFKELLNTAMTENNNILTKDYIELIEAYYESAEKASQNLLSAFLLTNLHTIRINKDFETYRTHEAELTQYDRGYDNNEEATESLKIKYQEIIIKNKAEKVEESYTNYIIANSNVDFTISKEKFAQCYECFYQVSKLSYYDDNYAENIIKLLGQDPHNQITLQELTQSVDILYSQGYKAFKYSDNINEQKQVNKFCQKFIQGKITPEQFIGEGFSLAKETNLFDRALIFRRLGQPTFYCQNINENDSLLNVSFSSDDISFYENLFQKNQIISFLQLNMPDFNYEKSKLNVSSLPNYKKLEQEKKDNYLPKIKKYVAYNVQELTSLKNYVKNGNEKAFNIMMKFSHKLKSSDKPVNFDYYNLLTGIKHTTHRDDPVGNAKEFFNLVGDFINTYQQNEYDKKIEKSNNSGNEINSLSYYGIKNLPSFLNKLDHVGENFLSLKTMEELGIPTPEVVVLPNLNAQFFMRDKVKWTKSLREAFPRMNLPELTNMMSGNQKIHNIGIDDQNYKNLCEKFGIETINNAVKKFMTDFCQIKFEKEVVFSTNMTKALFQFRSLLNEHNVPQDFETMFPLNKRQQYKWCLDMQMASLPNSAVTLEKSKLPKMEQYAGMVYSRDMGNNSLELKGEYVNAPYLYETSEAFSLDDLKEKQPKLYEELHSIAKTLEKENKHIQYLEFSIENDQLVITKQKNIDLPPVEKLKMNQDLYSEGIISQLEYLQGIDLKACIDFNSSTATSRQLNITRKVVEDVLEYFNIKVENIDFDFILKNKVGLEKSWMKTQAENYSQNTEAQLLIKRDNKEVGLLSSIEMEEKIALIAIKYIQENGNVWNRDMFNEPTLNSVDKVLEIMKSSNDSKHEFKNAKKSFGYDI
jgi:hypothetical protein